MAHYETNITAQVLEEMAGGSETAFRKLFDEYKDFVFGFACKMTDDEMAAKDIVQDIFIKLWLQREALGSIDNLTGYIQRLTRNHTINGLKRKAHEEVLLQLMAPAKGNATTEEAVLHRELQGLLLEAVGQLTGQQQKVYELSRNSGLSHAEIANELNISKETVKKHLMAAVKNIQQYINHKNSAIGVLAACLVELWN
jgi:RNA polymerase sigma-70 factor (family 1)